MNRIHEIFVVLNPLAGRGRSDQVRAALAKLSAHCEIYELTGQERVNDVVRSALDQGFDLIVAAGGDGTVSSVANGLIRTGVPLGIIPIGTGNMLARGLGIPLELDEAIGLLSDEHKVRQIDVMRVNNSFFVLNLGIGVSASTMRDTATQEKRRFGLAAYVWQGIKQVFGFQPHHFHFVVDDVSSQMRAAEVFIANGTLPIIPGLAQVSEITPDDGKLDVFVLRLRNAMDILRMVKNLFLRRSNQNARLRYFGVERAIAINSDRQVPVQADGELIGQTPVCVQVEPGALQVVVPSA